jgi:cytochrome c-type biogenesis protein CcmH/NrfG
MPHDVFISHANEDKAIADMVCATLEQQGLRCWVAPRDIQPGADWRQAILGAIRSSRAIVLVFSKHANASRHIPREVECAVEAGIPLIPFRVEDVQPQGALEYNLIGVHWLDAMTAPVEMHIRRLGDALRAVIELPRGRDADRDLAAPAAEPKAASPSNASSSEPLATKYIALVVAVALVTMLLVWISPWRAASLTSEAPEAKSPESSGTPNSSATPLDEQRVAALRQAAADRPTDAEPRIDLGNRYFDAERYQDAVPWYESALKLTPANVAVSTDLAVAYYYLGDIDRAERQLGRSLTMDPNNAKALLNKGIVLAFGRKDLEGAASVWRSLIAAAPNSDEAAHARKGLAAIGKH